MLSALINSTRVKLSPIKRVAAANLGFSMQRQQQTQWCWSAVSTSTSLFYRPGSGWSQCSLVNQELGQTGHCLAGNRRVGCWSSGLPKARKV
jgi:hypothetical protein